MQAVTRYLATHHGVITRAKAIELGMSKSAVARRVRAGRWDVIRPGVYRLAGAPDTWESTARGIALAYRGLMSHRAAARLWSLDGFGDEGFELSVDVSQAPIIDGVRVHRTTQLGLASPTNRYGVPTTGLARTVLDLAAVLNRAELNNLVDHVLRSRRLAWHDLAGVLARHGRRGRDGCGKLRDLVDERYRDKRPPGSVFNRLVGELLADAGVGWPVHEFELRDGDRFVARVDLAFPKHRVAVELDGRAFHDNPISFVEDRRRANRIVNLGWHLLSFSWDDYRDSPDVLVSTVRHAILMATPSEI